MNDLQKFIVAAKAAVYNKERARIYIPMLDSQQGAITAVMQVVSAIEQKKPIPPDVLPMFATQVYLLMIDMAMRVTGDKPDKDIMKQTLSALMEAISGPSKETQPTGMLGAANGTAV